MTDEMLVSFGGTLKSLGDARFGGFLVIYSDEHSPDLTGDFFTKATEFFVDDGARLPILYDHGFDPDLKRQKIGMGSLTKKDEGLWLEFQLDRRAKYVGAIEKMCAAGKCGLSSGAAGHLVSRQAFKNASWVAEWGLAEGSITPEPAEPRITIMPLKSYAESRGITSDDTKAAMVACPDCGAMNEADAKMCKDCKAKMPMKPAMKPKSLAERLTQYIDDSVDDGRDRDEIIKRLAREALMDATDVEKALKGETVLRGTAHLKAFARVLGVPYDTLKALADKSESRTIKGMFADELAGQQPSVWMLWNVYCGVVSKIAGAAESTKKAGAEFDAAGKMDEATAEYTSRLRSAVGAQVDGYVNGESEDEFYLKNGIGEGGFLVTEGLNFDEHSELVVTAFREIVKRFRDNHEMRKSTKAGRVLSDKNRQRLIKMLESIGAAVTDCHALLEETKPMANTTDKHAAMVAYQRMKHQLQRARIGV